MARGISAFTEDQWEKSHPCFLSCTLRPGAAPDRFPNASDLGTCYRHYALVPVASPAQAISLAQSLLAIPVRVGRARHLAQGGGRASASAIGLQRCRWP